MTQYSHINRAWLRGMFKKMFASGALPMAGRCQQCGRDKKLDKHHPNYCHLFSVVWLCRRCHQRHHNPGWYGLLLKRRRARALALQKNLDSLGPPELLDGFLSDSDFAASLLCERDALLRILDNTRKLKGNIGPDYS